MLHDRHDPLLLAAVEYIIPIYKGGSKYAYIAEEAITGNYESAGPNELFHMAKDKLQPYFDMDRRKALENYYNQIATPLTSSLPEKIIPASYYGQVSDLFIRRDTPVWGTFDKQSNRLQLNEARRSGDEDLAGQAAVQTFLNGGGVYFLDADKMPRGSILAAFLRYP